MQMTIYISDIELWGKVNEVYARVMGDHRPARAIVPVKDLHFGTRSRYRRSRWHEELEE